MFERTKQKLSEEHPDLNPTGVKVAKAAGLLFVAAIICGALWTLYALLAWAL